MEIESVIKQAQLDELCDPVEGDCESVAVALSNVFGGEEFVCIYDPTTPERPVHVTVRINNTLYDGTGSRTKEGLVDHISYLKLSDFGSHITTPEQMTTEIQENGLKIFSIEKYGTTLLKFDSHLVTQIETKLHQHL